MIRDRLQRLTVLTRAVHPVEWRRRLPRMVRDRIWWSGALPQIDADPALVLRRVVALPFARAVRARGLPEDHDGAVRRTLAGDLAWLGDPELAEVGVSPRWDALPGRPEWPSGPSRRLDLYAGSPVHGDVRRLWVLGKHLHFPVLAASDDPAARALLLRQWRSFVAHAPVGHGVQWRSELECAERALSWVVTLGLLAPEAHEVADLVDALLAHGAFLSERLTTWSWNHCIGEASVLAVLACLAPSPWSLRWRRRAVDALRDRVSMLVDSEGAYGEQSPPYGFLVLQYLRIAAEVLPARDARWLVERTDRMAAALASVAWEDGTLPRVGDVDDATLLLYPPRDVSLGDHPVFSWGSPAPGTARDRTLHVEGYGLTAFRLGEAEAVLNCDNRPLAGTVAPHVHDDVLQLSLRVRGAPVIVDRGTWSYTQDPERRWRYRGPEGHNGPEVDGRPTSAPWGPFRWSRLARGRPVEHRERSQFTVASARRRDLAATRHVVLTSRFLVVLDGTDGAARTRWRFAASAGSEFGPWAEVGDVAVRVVALRGDATVAWGVEPWSPYYGIERDGAVLDVRATGPWTALVVAFEQRPEVHIDQGGLALALDGLQWMFRPGKRHVSVRSRSV